MNKFNKGFTLVEILIALSIYALIAIITSSSLYYAFNTRKLLNKQTNLLTQLQLSMTLLRRDSEQIIERPIRLNEQQRMPAFIGKKNYIEFTRGGLINPVSQNKESYLRRIAYLCKKNQLIRRTWLHLDAVKRENFYEKILLSELRHCEFSFLNQNLNVLSEWRDNALQLNQEKEPFPKAIKLTFSLKKWGEFNQLFILPQALYAEIN